MSIELLIIIGALIVINIPTIVYHVITSVSSAKRNREIAEKPFVCPNCGERFHIKWFQLYGPKGWQLMMQGQSMFRCPKCNKKDLCKWTGNEY